MWHHPSNPGIVIISEDAGMTLSTADLVDAHGAAVATGEVDVPVTFGEVVFTPGAWLYSDEDGILVSLVELS